MCGIVAQHGGSDAVGLERLNHRGADDNGMFAFVVAGANGRLVAARDPVGIKPLYWAERAGSVRFALDAGLRARQAGVPHRRGSPGRKCRGCGSPRC